MCNICYELVNCPIGEKREVVVETPKRSREIDYYGHVLTVEPVMMFIDKYADHTDCCIKQDVYTEDSVHYGSVFDITHCPYCGQRLA